MHVQKTARDQFGPATDRGPFGDFNNLSETFEASAIVIVFFFFFFGRKAIASQSQAMCYRGLRFERPINTVMRMSSAFS